MLPGTVEPYVLPTLRCAESPVEKDIDNSIQVIIHGKCYDISEFNDHPGGPAWLKCVAGKDATRHFEMHHMRIERARSRLAKLPKMGDGKIDYKWNWNSDGFYATVRHRAATFLLEKAGQACASEEEIAHIPKAIWRDATNSTKEMRITRMFAITFYLVAFGLTCLSQWVVSAILCGVLTGVMGGFGHNAFHQRGRSWDCWLFELAGLSHEEWRVGDHTEHHAGTNLPSDPDTRSMEPFVVWGPSSTARRSSMLRRIFSPVAFHVEAALAISWMQATHFFCVQKKGEYRSKSGLVVPFGMLLILLLCGWLLTPRPDSMHFGPSRKDDSKTVALLHAFGLWALVWLSGSFYFMLVTSVTHNQEHNWSAIAKKGCDWGAWQLETTSDIEIPCGLRGIPLCGMTFLFLHEQTMHHLFPAIDHSRLHALRPLVQKTAEEFSLTLRPPRSYLDLYIGMLATIAGIPRRQSKLG